MAGQRAALGAEHVLHVPGRQWLRTPGTSSSVDLPARAAAALALGLGGNTSHCTGQRQSLRLWGRVRVGKGGPRAPMNLAGDRQRTKHSHLVFPLTPHHTLRGDVDGAAHAL